ncbi:MAG: DNA polymerase III subunit delta [Actinobacteria bacterium]|nr:DNA polymerase III subunit delta [Actinomycetota bacterium]
MSFPVYLLSGEEFLVDEALDRVRGETGCDPLAEITLPARTAGHEILGTLGTASLLGGCRLVIIESAQDMLKEQVEALTRYLESPSPSSILVLVATGRTKLDAQVKKIGALVSLEAPKGRKLASWVKDRARSKKMKIDERAPWALIDAVGNELRDLDAALDQLGTRLGPDGTIGVPQIKAAFARHADERIYSFTDAVGERKLPRAMELLRRLYDQGEDPLPLLGALTNHIRRLLRARRHADRGAAAVGDVLGMPGWRAERMATQARSYSEDELVDAMGFLAEADVEMKGGDLPPQAALERAVVKIVER